MIKSDHLDCPRAQEYSLTQLLGDFSADFLRDELWDAAMEDDIELRVNSEPQSILPCCDVLAVLCGLHGAGLLRAVNGVLHQELLALLLPLHQATVVPSTDGSLHLVAECGGLAGVALCGVDCLAHWLRLSSRRAGAASVGWDLKMIRSGQVRSGQVRCLQIVL